MHKNVEIDDYVAFGFGVNAADGSADDGTSAVYDVRKCGASSSAAPTLSGSATLLTDAGYISGCYEVYFQVTSPTFDADATYLIFVTVTVDGTITPTKCLGSFTVAAVPARLVASQPDYAPATAAQATAIENDTNELQTDWTNGGRLDLILDARASQTSVDDVPTNAELATALADADDATLAAIAALNNLSAAEVNAEADTALADAKAGYAAAIEAAILNEGDATALLAAIAAKVEEFLINEGDATATIAAIATAVNAAVAAGTVGTNAATAATEASSANAIVGSGTHGNAALKTIIDTKGSQTSVDAVDTKVVDVQSRVPAALVSGRMDASVGAMANNTLTAAALATDAVAEIQLGLATQATLAAIGAYVDTEVAQILVDTTTLLSRLTALRAGYLDNLSAGVATAANVDAIPDALLAAGDVDGYTVEQTLRLLLAALAGKLAGASGAETSETITLRAADDSKTRITATCDVHGNRTALTLDAT